MSRALKHSCQITLSLQQQRLHCLICLAGTNPVVSPACTLCVTARFLSECCHFRAVVRSPGEVLDLEPEQQALRCYEDGEGFTAHMQPAQVHYINPHLQHTSAVML